MTEYVQLLLTILPVFTLIGIGIVLRRLNWLAAEADGSLLRLVVNWLYPCLIFENVINNDALRNPSNLALAPLTGCLMMASTIVFSYYAGRALGLSVGGGLRTFAFATGINNYGYLPIPILQALYPGTLGVLLVHNVGCEVAVWTVGILVLSGLSLREGWRRLISAPIIALIIALAGNLLGVSRHIPGVVTEVIHLSAQCSIPLGLMLIGATVAEYISRPRELVDARLTSAACVLRLGLFPLAFLLVAKFVPMTIELKRVIVVQGAMPAGILPLVIAKHYGGQPLTAVRVVIGTTVVGLLAIPLWIRLGLSWIGD